MIELSRGAVVIVSSLQMQRPGSKEWRTMNKRTFTTGETETEKRDRKEKEQELAENRDRWSRMPEYADCKFRIVNK